MPILYFSGDRYNGMGVFSCYDRDINCLFLLKALVSHINTRAERLELQRIREKEQKQRKQESKQKNQGKTNNTSIPHRVTRPQSNDIDYDYYRLKELREEQAAYDDYIASLDMDD